MIVTAGRDLATLAALCIYCTQHNQSKHIPVPAIVPWCGTYGTYGTVGTEVP